MNKYGDFFLKAAGGALVGGAAVWKRQKEKLEKTKLLVNKNELIIQTMDKWIRLKQENKKLETYFETFGYRSVAIYGMGYLGQRLYDELRGSDIEVVYAIDQNRKGADCGLDVFPELDGNIPEADVIVVTAVASFDKIEEEAVPMIDIPLISFVDIMNEVLNMDGVDSGIQKNQ